MEKVEGAELVVNAKRAGRSGKVAKARGKTPSKKGSTKKSGNSFFRRVLKRVLLTLLCLALLPVALSFIYKVPGVHPVSMLMVSHYLAGKPIKRDWVDFDNMSPFVFQSVLSAEDGQYCSHSGVDWDAINLVVDDFIDGERARGASTIPMQSVKNLFLWSSRSYLRKGLEVPLALMLNAILGKKRQMEIYLNIAEWGPGIFGIEAAAQHHFKRSAKQLSRRQAALLAVTLPNPHLRDPGKPRRGMQRLARLVEKRARQSGAYIGCLK